MSWSEYNGDTVHDMYVDGMYANCGNNPYSDCDEQGGYIYAPAALKPEKLTPIQKCQRSIGRLQAAIDNDRRRLAKREAYLAKVKEDSRKYRKGLNRIREAEERLARNTQALEEKRAELAVLKRDYRKRLAIGLSLLCLAIASIMLCIFG